jgi:hypothetical protein
MRFIAICTAALVMSPLGSCASPVSVDLGNGGPFRGARRIDRHQHRRHYSPCAFALPKALRVSAPVNCADDVKQ